MTDSRQQLAADLNESAPLIQPEIERVQVEYIPIPNTKLMLVKLILTIVSLGSVILYLTPSKDCSDDPVCGKFVKDYLGKNAADVIFFGCGSLNLALLSGYYGAQSVDKLSAAFKDLSSKMKIYKTAEASIIAITQLGHIFITAASTHSKFWQILVSVLGYIPTALFTAVNLPKEFPLVKNEIKKRFKHLISSCQLTEDSQAYLHYEREQAIFNEKSAARLRDIVSRINEFDTPIINEGQALDYIFNNSIAVPDHSLAAGMTYAYKFIGGIAGAGFAGILSYSATVNSASFLEGQIPKILADMIGVLVSVATIYTNFKLIPSGMSSVVQSVSDFLRGRPYNSLQYYIHPNFVRAFTLLGCGTAPFSSAVISSVAKNVFTEEKYPNEVERDTLRILAMIAVCLIHYRGTINCSNILSSALNQLMRNEKACAFEKMAAEVEEMMAMSVEQFKQKVENDFTPEQLTLFGIRPFEPIFQNDLPINFAPPAQENIPTRSWWRSGLSFCSAAPIVATEEEIVDNHLCLIQ